MMMKKLGTFPLFATVVFLIGVVFSFPCRAQVVYEDDFSTHKAETDSDFHSIFWPEGAFPPSMGYLYFTGSDRLAFAESQSAVISYSFTIDTELPKKTVSGIIYIDVLESDNKVTEAGYLYYSLSEDGVKWSNEIELGYGKNIIPVKSVTGICYIQFRGKQIFIDNLKVELSSKPAMIVVPDDFPTIQAAINASSNRSIIEVNPGIYTGEGNTDIDFLGKAITLRSVSGPNETIIECAEGQRGFHFFRNEEPNSVLQGFTIVGAGVSGTGGGIYCDSSSPSIINCFVEGCSAQNGGAIGAFNSSPAIINCIIEDCKAGYPGSSESGYGGAICLLGDSNALIIDCHITDNNAFSNGYGGGIYCEQSHAIIAGCNISSNSAYGVSSGGGIYCWGGDLPKSVSLQNCVISKNIARSGTGIYADLLSDISVTNCTIADNYLFNEQHPQNFVGGIFAVDSNMIVTNSIVYFNDGQQVKIDNDPNSYVRYSNIEGGYEGQGNINEDPNFAAPTEDDYHLKSPFGRYENGQWLDVNDVEPLSDCIDAGDPQSSLGAEPFPNKNRVNMGAYGGTSQASKSVGPLIIHVDCINGNNSNTGLSRDDALATIQKAVDWTIDGDIIMVWPGTYYEEVYFKGKAITIQSADEAAVVSPHRGYAFSFYDAEGSDSILRNLIITGCPAGAIYCLAASPTLANLTITGNSNGIYAENGADPTITNCILWDNQGGDLVVDSWQPRIYYSCVEHILMRYTANEIDMSSNHNITDNPLFANPENGDFHLKSIYGRYSTITNGWVYDTLTSPCIDSGDLDMRIGREPISNGDIINMGAYGGTPFASKSNS